VRTTAPAVVILSAAKDLALQAAGQGIALLFTESTKGTKSKKEFDFFLCARCALCALGATNARLLNIDSVR
jgi:hypothetical protein